MQGSIILILSSFHKNLKKANEVLLSVSKTWQSTQVSHSSVCFYCYANRKKKMWASLLSTAAFIPLDGSFQMLTSLL